MSNDHVNTIFKPILDAICPQGQLTLRVDRDKFRTLQRTMERGCPQCDLDEAEGAVVDHCAMCCRDITSQCYDLFVYPQEVAAEPIREPLKDITGCDY